MVILEWLGIIILAVGIIYWSLKAKESQKCCPGCESCPLQNKCEKPDIAQESGVKA